MQDRLLGALQGFESAGDQMIARLGQDLDRDVVGDPVFLDQFAHEVEIGLRGAGEPDLDLLEPHFDQGLEHPHFAFRAHRFDQGLVAVPQIGRCTRSVPW